MGEGNWDQLCSGLVNLPNIREVKKEKREWRRGIYQRLKVKSSRRAAVPLYSPVISSWVVRGQTGGPDSARPGGRQEMRRVQNDNRLFYFPESKYNKSTARAEIKGKLACC